MRYRVRPSVPLVASLVGGEPVSRARGGDPLENPEWRRRKGRVLGRGWLALGAGRRASRQGPLREVFELWLVLSGRHRSSAPSLVDRLPLFAFGSREGLAIHWSAP